MRKIVTIGELLLRFSTQPGERLQQADQLAMHYGGAEANVAISLANFGLDVHMVSKVPHNPLGIGAERHLRAHGVQTEMLLKGGERLGTYYMEAGIGERSAQVTYDRKYSSITTLSVHELDFDELLRDADLFHVTGITPALSAELQEITLLSLRAAKERGINTSFDFNYRSKLWSQQEASNAFEQYLPYVDYAFCGELDAIYILGIQEADAQLNKSEKLAYYYKEIQAIYPNIRVLSSTFREVLSASSNTLQGNIYIDGVLYQSKVHEMEPIVDRVGGGDAFAAGVIYGIIEGMEPDELIDFATAGSALKHTVHGDCNVFSVDEIKAFAKQESGKIVR